MNRNLIIDKNQREMKQYGTDDFPFRIGYENILDYHNHQCSCHWHNVLELLCIFDGTMYCQVNDRSYILNSGDVLFINSNALHFVKAIKAQSCKYCAINFPSELLAREHSIIYKKYVQPIVYAQNLSSYLLCENTTLPHKQITASLLQIAKLHQDKPACYEMRTVISLLKFWEEFFLHVEKLLSPETEFNLKTARIKSILMYIHANYAQKLTLKQIAQASQISVSECSHLFKQYVKESPFEYLLHYRIEQSLSLLQQKQLSITQIALNCGFTNSSYYARIFKRYMNISPKKYQNNENKNHIRDDF